MSSEDSLAAIAGDVDIGSEGSTASGVSNIPGLTVDDAADEVFITGSTNGLSSTFQLHKLRSKLQSSSLTAASAGTAAKSEDHFNICSRLVAGKSWA